MASRARSAARRVGAAIVLAAVPAALAAGQIRFGEPAFHQVGADARRAITSDVNGDAHADIVTANTESSDLSLLLGDGSGGFAAEQRLLIPFSPATLIAADFDADGNADLCTAARGGPDMLVLLGDGAGGFPAAVPTRVGFNASRTRAADFDRDGVLDVVASFSTQASAFFGDGAGGFGPAVPVGVPSTHENVSADAGDFDEDGLPDVIVSARRRPVLGPPAPIDGILFLGTGSRAFTASGQGPFPLAPDGTGQGAVEAADLNGDSHLDLVAPDPPASALDVSFGSGQGAFAPAIRIAASRTQVNLAIADMDADGDVDLTTVRFYPDLSGAVSRGDGSGGFLPEETFPVYRYAFSLVSDDFDEDGHSDLAINFRGATSLDDVGVFLNRSPELCAAGTVNAGAGPPANVLFVNDSPGSSNRRVTAFDFEPVTVFVAAPPAAQGPAPFALYGYAGLPDQATELPRGVGSTCLPMPPSGAHPRLRAIWNNIGRPAVLGEPTLPSTPAPSVVFSAPNGVRRRVTFFLQGLILDSASPNGRAAVTNGVTVDIR